MTISKHARKRMDQRAIPEAWVFLLQFLGEEVAQKGGTSVVGLSKDSAQRLRCTLRDLLGRLDHLSNVYAVVADDGTVVTTFHRTWRAGRATKSSGWAIENTSHPHGAASFH